MTRVVKHKQNDQSGYRQTSKSKQTENETVFLERKMFWKVDKHKRNDQSGIPLPILHLFGITIFFRIHARAERSPERELQAKVEVKADTK